VSLILSAEIILRTILDIFKIFTNVRTVLFTWHFIVDRKSYVLLLVVIIVACLLHRWKKMSWL